jgi:hypothetical protein
MKTITIVSEDRVGLLADISYILSKSRINIDSINANLIGKKFIITLLVKDSQLAREVLSRGGYTITEAESIVVKIPNRLGEIEKVSERLATNGINIENVTMLSVNPSEGVFVLKVDKPKKACSVLSDILVDAD